MKLKTTFTVKLESPDGDAVFTFRYGKTNEELAAQKRWRDEKDQLEKLDDNWKHVLGNLVKVDGFEREDGKPITVEDFQKLELPFATTLAVVNAYYATLYPKEDAEKKEPVPA